MKYLNIYLCVFLLSFSGLTFSKETVHLAIGEWGPFTSENDRLGKMAESLVRRALRASSFKVKYHYTGWDQAYTDAKKGIREATFPWQKTPDRLKDFYAGEEALVVSKEVFFHRRGEKFNWKKIEDLSRYRIGGIEAYSHLKVFEENGLNVLVEKSPEIQFENLMSGKIDAFPENLYVGHYTIKKTFPRVKRNTFEAYDQTTLQEAPMYVLVSKNSPRAKELVDAIDEGIRYLKNTGKYEEILAFYLSNQ